MFVTSKYHQKIISLMEAERDLLIRGYEARIEQYLAQIEDFRKMVFLPKAEASPQVYEADSVISGSDKPFEMTEEERSKILEGQREFDAILSGNYDTDLIN